MSIVGKMLLVVRHKEYFWENIHAYEAYRRNSESVSIRSKITEYSCTNASVNEAHMSAAG
jgi:hypothetical protein